MIYRKRSPLILVWIKAVLIIFPLLIIFSIVWLRSNIVAFEYDMGQLQLQKANLINEKRELTAKKARLASVQKITYFASNEMGVTYPDRKNVFYISSSYVPVTNFGFRVAYLKDRELQVRNLKLEIK